MKKFVLKIFLFCLPIILSLIVIEIILDNIKSVYTVKNEQLMKNKDKIQLLILGNSHTNDGINPSFFRIPAFNFGNVSQSLPYDKLLLLKYLPELKNLKYVVFCVDYPSLYWGYEPERDYFYYKYYGFNRYNMNYYKERVSEFFFVYTPYIACKLIFDDFFNTNKFQLVNGWQAMSITDYGNFNKSAAIDRLANFNQIMANCKEHNTICKEFDDLLAMLIKKGIKPIIVSPPIHHLIRDMYNKNILNINKKYIEYIINKYNIQYFNSMNDSTFTTQDFYNLDHLNTDGAAKYSRMLDSLIFINQ